MTLGEKMQKLRKARSWTQEELAEKVGVSRQSLSKWESDGALPDTANIIVLADLFGVTTDYLLRSGEDMPAAEEPKHDAPQAVAPVVQFIPPQKKSPSVLLVIGCILLTLGLIVWLGIRITELANPWTAHVNGETFTGIQGFIRAKNIVLPYYVSLTAIFVGMVTIITTLFLQWWVNRHSD